MSDILQMPNPQQDEAAMIAQIKSRIMSHAAAIYPMIPIGATIECRIPLRGAIITPGQEQEYGLMFIHRPAMVDVIQGKLK